MSNDQGHDLRGAGDPLAGKIRDVLAGTGPEVTLQDLWQWPAQSAGDWELASKHRTTCFAIAVGAQWPGVEVLRCRPENYGAVEVGMPDEPSFADHPTTLGEKRAERSTRAGDWTPRDLLVKLLREHDSGEVVLTDLVVSFKAGDVAGFWNSCADRTTAVGLATQAMVSLSIEAAP